MLVQAATVIVVIFFGEILTTVSSTPLCMYGRLPPTANTGYLLENVIIVTEVVIATTDELDTSACHQACCAKSGCVRFTFDSYGIGGTCKLLSSAIVDPAYGSGLESGVRGADWRFLLIEERHNDFLKNSEFYLQGGKWIFDSDNYDSCNEVCPGQCYQDIHTPSSPESMEVVWGFFGLDFFPVNETESQYGTPYFYDGYITYCPDCISVPSFICGFTAPGGMGVRYCPCVPGGQSDGPATNSHGFVTQSSDNSETTLFGSTGDGSGSNSQGFGKQSSDNSDTTSFGSIAAPNSQDFGKQSSDNSDATPFGLRQSSSDNSRTTNFGAIGDESATSKGGFGPSSSVWSPGLRWGAAGVGLGFGIGFVLALGMTRLAGRRREYAPIHPVSAT